MTTVTPLRVRTGWSLLRGTARPGDVLALAGKLGHAQLAMTDVNGTYGLTSFCKQADAMGIAPLVGAELTAGRRSAVTLVDSAAGYAHLCELITRRWASGAAQRNLADDLAELAEGVNVVVDEPAFAEALLSAGLGRDRLHLGIDPACQSLHRLAELDAAARRFDLPLTATGQALRARPADIETARLLAAIRTGGTLETVSAGDLPHARAVLRSPRQLADDLASWPQAIANNRRLVERCAAFRLLPREPVFPRFPCPGGLSAQAYLRRLCRQGLRRRYGPVPPPAAEARLDRELRLIERMGFCEYFLVVWDIVGYARRHDAPVAGRGSGASSIVAYTLGITNVCPIDYHIPFERVLHEGREDFPDLDVDFCWRIRDDVIDYAFQRWGRDRTAMVSMHTTFQPKSAFRETAKAMGYSDAQITRMARRGRDGGPAGAIGRLARRIAHLPHVLSVHPGGIVIAPEGITRHAPIQPSAKGVMITQPDKDGVEDLRLVKLDLLGNRNLATVRYACRLVRERTGREVDIEAIAPDDPATVATLQSGDTVGCNQLESPAMRHLLEMTRPADTRDVMRILALIRPGAASIGMKETFVRRCRGIEPVPPAPPQVAGLLAETFGVMLYEDDVMLVAAALTGDTLSQADRFRKAVQKCRDDDERLRLSRDFLGRCRRNGVDVEWAKGLWVQMAKFNAYSFCRAHAGSYALLSYAGAYLKTHHPLEFWTAALNNNQSMYHPRVYVEQARRAGVRFLGPDVNRSAEEFTIEDTPAGPALRAGLNLLAGLGPVTVQRLLDRRADRPYAGLSDLLERTALGVEEARSLILCGALDFTGRTRPTLMMELNLHRRLSPHAAAGDVGLLPAAATVPNAPGDYDDQRKYFDQRRILGVSIDGHVMAWFRPVLAGRVDADSRDLPHRVGRRVRLAGVVEARRSTAAGTDGKPMMFLTLDDEFGLFEVTVFPDILARAHPRLDRYGPYLVTGRVEDQYGSLTVTAERVEHLAIDPTTTDLGGNAA